jgi:hypothetical protein
MHCLGRKAVKTDTRTLRLAKYLPSSLPSPPPAMDWTMEISSFGEMLNNQIGDCTIAGLGHAIQIWSANTSTEITLPDTTIQSAYEDWCGYDPNNPDTDRGGIELDVLTDWRRDGLGGHKLLAFADPSVTNLTEVRTAIDLFGGVYIGLNLPISAQTQEIWDNVDSGNGKDNVAGSWGGHAVFVPAYDTSSFTCITWGTLKKMTTDFWLTYCDEAHALLSPDWIAQTVPPGRFDLATLKADLALIH